MAYPNLSQGNKDIDADIFEGFGSSSLSGFIPHSYNVNDGMDSLDHDPFPSMDDHHALSLQPDDDSLQTPFFSLNSKFNPTATIHDDPNDNTSTQSTLSQLSPTSPQEANMMQFPGHHSTSNSASPNNINQALQNNNNPSPGSTASTSSVHQMQPKMENNLGFESITNYDPLQQQFNGDNAYHNEYFNDYLNTSLNIKQHNGNNNNLNRIKHEPQIYDRVINEFMNDYHNDKQQHHQQIQTDHQWMFGAVPFVPPSYTNSATARINSNGLCENIPVNTSPVPQIPHIPHIANHNNLSIPPNYAISNAVSNNYVANTYYHQQQQQQHPPIVHEAIATNIENTVLQTPPKYTKAPLSSNNAKKYQCKQCSKKFKHHSNLKIHLIVHTDKALVCGYCSKKFARKTNLKQHERVHTGERPFECNICKRKFKQKHSLKDHIKIHTGEKPFVCEYCNKSFKIKHNLTLHIRTHTGEKPHQCPLCLTSFACQKDLRNHKYQCGVSTATNIMPIMNSAHGF